MPQLSCIGQWKIRLVAFLFLWWIFWYSSPYGYFWPWVFIKRENSALKQTWIEIWLQWAAPNLHFLPECKSIFKSQTMRDRLNVQENCFRRLGNCTGNSVREVAVQMQINNKNIYLPVVPRAHESPKNRIKKGVIDIIICNASMTKFQQKY